MVAKYVSALVLALLIEIPVIESALAFPGERELPESPPAHYELVGEARLSVLWFDVYDASLLSNSGRYNPSSEPLLLKLSYLRDISRERLIKETQKQLRDQLPEARLASALEGLRAIWPDIEKGDRLAFWLAPNGAGGFYHNGRFLGEMADEQFNRAFIGIWLAEDSQYPKLAQALRGGSD